MQGLLGREWEMGKAKEWVQGSAKAKVLRLEKAKGFRVLVSLFPE